MGLIAMQVCAISDATDQEILDVCNRENPAGTTNGWGRVVRSVEPDEWAVNETSLPVPCGDDATRTHFLVTC
jgi:hypothetical protein